MEALSGERKVRYDCITWPVIVTLMCGCNDVSQGNSDAEASGRNTDRASQTRTVVELTKRQPVFKSRSLENLNMAFRDLLKRREGELEVIVPLRSDKVHIVGKVNVRKGSVTFETAEGTFTYLPDDNIRITAGRESEEISGWCAQGAAGHIRIGPFTQGEPRRDSEATFDVAVFFAHDVRGDEGNPIDHRARGHAIPCEIRNGKAVVTLRLIASDDFEGEVAQWQQPAYR